MILLGKKNINIGMIKSNLDRIVFQQFPRVSCMLIPFIWKIIFVLCKLFMRVLLFFFMLFLEIHKNVCVDV